MVKNRTSKIMLLIIVFVFLLILPNYSNAAKVSVGKVKGVKIKEQNTTSLKISWKSVSKVNGYKVYICDNSENEFKYYGKTTSKSMTIKKLKTSKEYKIKIRGYKIVKKKTYYGSYSSILKVATKPTQVKSLKVKSETDTSVKLNWSKVTRASGYRVYIYNSSKKKYEYYGYSKTNYIMIEDLKALQTYKIRVRAYKTVEGKRTYGTYSKVVIAKTKFSKVNNLKAESQTDNSITLSWKKVSKATGYRVYKYNSSKKKYELYKDVKTNKITINKLKSSEIYKFKVRAYKTVKKKNEYGLYADILTTATKPTEVKSVKVKSQNDTEISLTWDKVKRATGYRIYIYNELKDSYDYYGYTKTNSITLNKLTPATIYKIRVRAYKQVDDTKVLGPNPKQILETFTKPSQVTNFIETENTLTSLKLSWDKMSDLAEYEIYMYNSSSKKYEYMDKTLNTSYEVFNLKYATGYKFRIRAYITINDKKYYGSYTDLQAGTLPNKVTGLKSTEQTIDSIKIEWNKVEEATGYAVYVYSQYSQSFKLYKNTTNTSMIISDLDIAKFYKIYVKSYVTIEGKTYYSDESNTISQKTKSTENIKAGIDVSKYQADINWKKVKDSGVEFAIIRIGYRGYGDKGTICEDPYFKDNIKEAMAEGIEVGVYFFSYAIDEKEAEEEAKWVIDTLNKNDVDISKLKYIAHDFESYNQKRVEGVSKAQINKNTIAFLKYIKEAGYTPVLYGSKYYLTSIFNTKYILSVVEGCKIWLAQYNDTETYEGNQDMWQYSSTGMISGINGNVDLNIIYIEEKEVE